MWSVGLAFLAGLLGFGTLDVASAHHVLAPSSGGPVFYETSAALAPLSIDVLSGNAPSVAQATAKPVVMGAIGAALGAAQPANTATPIVAPAGGAELPPAKLPKLDNYFTMPVNGWDWGVLHYDNAVDIAAPCGTPIRAAAEGIVEAESASGAWNDGYGNYITIHHPNGTYTRYAHTMKNFVVVGSYVLRGDEIALVGNTGHVDGPTGCHLHFEVHGAQNPFAAH